MDFFVKLMANYFAYLFFFSQQTRLTICEGHDGTETSNGDVLIFPDMVRYRSDRFRFQESLFKYVAWVLLKKQST